MKKKAKSLSNIYLPVNTHKTSPTRVAVSEKYLRVAFLSLGLSLTLVMAWELARSRQRIIDDTKGNLEKYAAITSTTIGERLNRIDTAMKNWAIWLSEKPERINSDIDLHLKARKNTLADIEGLDIHVVDPSGDYLLPKSEPDDASIAPHENVASEKWFEKLKINPQQETILTEPIRSRIKPQRFLVILAHRISSPSGEFLGAIVASIEASYLSKARTELNLGVDSDFALVAGDDLSFLDYFPPRGDIIGKRLPQSELYQEVLSGEKQSHVTIGNSPMDGDEQILAFRWIRGLRLLVITGIDLHPLLWSWYRQVLFYSLSLIMMFTAGTYFLIRHRTDLHVVARIQQNLALERFKLQQIVSKAPAILYTLDLYNDRKTNFISPGIEIFGYQPEAFTENPEFWLLQIHPHDFDRVMNQRRSVVNQRTVHMEYRFRRSDGAYHWVRDHLSMSVDSNGITTDLIGFLQDVDYEIATRERFELLYEAIDRTAIISTTDRHGHITHVNDRFCEISGYSREELLGQSHRLLNSGNHEPAFFKTLWTALKGNKVWRGEIRNRSKDGAFYWVNTTISPYFSGGGRDNSFISISFETTQEKDLQEMLFTSAKLSALGEMSGGVAHEINNPIAIIISKARLLQRRILADNVNKEQIAADLKKIEDTGNRIARIVKGLRTFTRKGENDPLEMASLQQIINETIDLCAERFKLHSVELRLADIPAATLQCRPIEISQIILNLLNNAHDAIENLEERWIEIGATVTNETVRIAVTDSGHGIAPEVVSKIMEPFFTTKGIGRGTGLGLSISSGIAKSHHGELFYDPSSANTRFILQLPLNQFVQLDKAQ